MLTIRGQCQFIHVCIYRANRQRVWKSSSKLRRMYSRSQQLVGSCMHHPKCAFTLLMTSTCTSGHCRLDRSLELLADPRAFFSYLTSSFISFSTEPSIILKVLWSQSILSSPMLADCRSQLTHADYWSAANKSITAGAGRFCSLMFRPMHGVSTVLEQISKNGSSVVG